MVAARVLMYPDNAAAQPPHAYLATGGPRKTVLNVPQGEVIFHQGDPGDCVFYIQKGRVKISITSQNGKEATLSLQNKGDFIGHEVVANPCSLRLATAIAIQPCTVLRIDSLELTRMMHTDKLLAHVFQSFLLTHCAQMQASLIDHLFNSSEKRLARTLLLLAQLEGGIESAISHINQETLAEMIGTTRSRVSFFMNRFRKLGYVQYQGANSTVNVHHSLFNILLQD